MRGNESEPGRGAVCADGSVVTRIRAAGGEPGDVEFASWVEHKSGLRSLRSAKPVAVMNLLAAISGKHMGLIDIRSAAPVAWSDPGPASIHPDDYTLLERACATLRTGLPTNSVVARLDVGGGWRCMRLELVALSDHGQSVALFEVEDLEQPAPVTVSVVQI